MRNFKAVGLALVAGVTFVAGAALSGAAHASAVDFDEKVYSPIIEDGETSLETRQGRSFGKASDGAAGGVVELEHGFNDRFSLAILGMWDKAPGESAKLNELGVESVINLGTIPVVDIDYGAYLEYAQDLNGGGGTGEAKVLFQKRKGRFDSRLNLIVERPFSQHGARTGVSYAASADWAVTHDFQVGAEAFGEMAEGGDWGGRRAHYAGPLIKYTINSLPYVGIKIEAAWLAAIGAARTEANSQARLVVEFEKRF